MKSKELLQATMQELDAKETMAIEGGAVAIMPLSQRPPVGPPIGGGISTRP